MTSGKIFWGIFFLFMGILLLLLKLDVIQDVELSFIFDLWPLFLIFLGISLLKISLTVKKILVGLSAVILSFFVTSMAVNGVNCVSNCNFVNIFDDGDDNSDINNYNFKDSIPFMPAKEVTLSISGNIASMKLEDETNNLIDVHSKGSNIQNFISFDSSDNKIDVNIETNGKFKKSSRKSKISLNTMPVWNLNFDLGVSKFYGNLTKYKIKNISVEGGASNVELVMGDLLDTSNIKVETGISKVKIKIPKQVGCQIQTNTGLSGKHFENFVKGEDDIYYSENYRTSAKKIFVMLDGGLSHFEVDFY